MLRALTVRLNPAINEDLTLKTPSLDGEALSDTVAKALSAGL
jgi:hypothetical protein